MPIVMWVMPPSHAGSGAPNRHRCRDFERVLVPSDNLNCVDSPSQQERVEPLAHVACERLTHVRGTGMVEWRVQRDDEEWRRRTVDAAAELVLQPRGLGGTEGRGRGATITTASACRALSPRAYLEDAEVDDMQGRSDEASQ